ncbi:MAG: TOBE domain-containing protein, partial [Actinomycetota bacterium]|nr:TOBE domain-containing protein [Actinomycetota bacterium]
ALARALAPAPALLLLDEPLASLDVEARRSIRHQLRTHLDAFRGPCLLVTHDPLDAATLAGRLTVLESGRVTQSGTVEEVTRRPRSDWIAELAGVNLYRGWGREGRVEFGAGAALVAPERVDGEVFAVIRPQAVALHRSRPHGTPRNVWSGQVATVDGRGDRMRVRVDGALPIVAEVTPAAVAELDLGRGGPVWVSVKATEVDLYPV